MGERDDHEPQQQQGRRPESAPALVEEQVESARAGVFRAYVRAREQARRLAEEGPGPDGDDSRRAS